MPGQKNLAWMLTFTMRSPSRPCDFYFWEGKVNMEKINTKLD